MAKQTRSARSAFWYTEGLQEQGLSQRGEIRRNLSPAELYEETLRAGTGKLAQGGALVTCTAPHTGRSPNDRFIVRERDSDDTVDWGSVNIPLSASHYDALKTDVISYLNGRDLYVRDARAGADPRYGLDVHMITDSPWHDLFARNMFLRFPPAETVSSTGYTVYHAPGLQADPARHGTSSGAFVVLNLSARDGVNRRYNLRGRN